MIIVAITSRIRKAFSYTYGQHGTITQTQQQIEFYLFVENVEHQRLCLFRIEMMLNIRSHPKTPIVVSPFPASTVSQLPGLHAKCKIKWILVFIEMYSTISNCIC